ncbi:MAG: hypothetical protein FWF97_04395 [Alphaproteobacteria bacterium]|nr:hypothetical protein [Alphaproteobacteria bacterium]
MTRIIAGFAGIGKTTLAKKYKNVLDLEAILYKYSLENTESLGLEAIETIKGERSVADKKPNPDWPDNYIAAIKNNINKYDYILVWCHPEEILPHFDNSGIDYELFIPTIDALDEYRQRFINRGNSEEFVNHVSSKESYDMRLPQFKAIGKPIIFLKTGETLESYFINSKDYPPLLAF